VQFWSEIILVIEIALSLHSFAISKHLYILRPNCTPLSSNTINKSLHFFILYKQLIIFTCICVSLKDFFLQMHQLWTYILILLKLFSTSILPSKIVMVQSLNNYYIYKCIYLQPRNSQINCLIVIQVFKVRENCLSDILKKPLPKLQRKTIANAESHCSPVP